MPRLRKAPNAPEDQSVEIEVAEDEIRNSRSDAKPETAEPPRKDGEPDLKRDSEPEVQVVGEEDQASRRDEDDNSLKRQLEELRASELRVKQEYEAEKQRRLQAEQLAEQQRQQAHRSQQDVHQAQYDWVLSTIAAAQTESEAAQRDYETALASQDFRGASDAQKRMSRAEARLMQLEDAKTNFETARAQQTREAPRQQQQQQYQQQGDPIDQLTQLTQRERDWLRQHREVIADQGKQDRLRAAYWEATEDRGLERDSPEYFRYLEERLGYKKKFTERREPSDPDEGRGDFSQMPVTRDGGSSGRGPSQTVRLSAEERDIAHSSMPSLDPKQAELEYAKQKIRMLREKQAGRISG